MKLDFGVFRPSEVSDPFANATMSARQSLHQDPRGAPSKPFVSLDAARVWVELFVLWYVEALRSSGRRIFRIA